MLDNRIERESKLIRKYSVTVLAEQTFQSSLDRNMVQGEIPTDPTELTLYDVGAGVEIISTENPPSYKFVNEVKSEVKLQILSNENELSNLESYHKLYLTLPASIYHLLYHGYPTRCNARPGKHSGH